LRHHLKFKKNSIKYSMNRIENEKLNISRVDNGRGAALGSKLGMDDPCIAFF
jgi:hypothetical protein